MPLSGFKGGGIGSGLCRGHPPAPPCATPAADFFKRCTEVADEELQDELQKLCLDPARKLSAGGPWYFPRLIETLRDFQTCYVQAKGMGIVTTALGQKVCDVLDYTFRIRGFTLIEGHARRGKSFAAENWVARNPGRARFIEVPTGNDDASFFRGLARGLGLGGFQQYKVSEIRERVESVLLTGQLLLVLDEAQRLWPQMNMRYGFPKRITWLMSLANKNIPICAIATPQFMELQKASAEKNQWNSAQLAGRISHYEPLPENLSESDLIAVSRSVLPGVDRAALAALADYASLSVRYLGAIKAVKDRANDFAQQAGRPMATTADVRRALNESVIPSDRGLVRALETGRKGMAARNVPPAPALPDLAARAASGDDLAPDLAGSQAEPVPAPRRGGLETPLPAARRGNMEATEAPRRSGVIEPLTVA